MAVIHFQTIQSILNRVEKEDPLHAQSNFQTIQSILNTRTGQNNRFHHRRISKLFSLF